MNGFRTGSFSDSAAALIVPLVDRVVEMTTTYHVCGVGLVAVSGGTRDVTMVEHDLERLMVRHDRRTFETRLIEILRCPSARGKLTNRLGNVKAALTRRDNRIRLTGIGHFQRIARLDYELSGAMLFSLQDLIRRWDATHAPGSLLERSIERSSSF